MILRFLLFWMTIVLAGASGVALSQDADPTPGEIEFATKVWPLLEQGKCGPRIFQVFPLAEAAAAHRLMESSAHVGKIMLKLG